MKKALLAIVIIASITLASCASKQAAAVDNSGKYNEAVVEDMKMEWRTDETNIYIRLTAPDDGWLSVGFEPEAVMKGADIIIAYVEEGKGFIRDDFGSSRFLHKADAEEGGSDDVTLQSFSESEDKGTVVEFTRALDTGDSKDKVLSPGKSYTIMLAYSGSDSFGWKHKKAYLTELEL